MSFVNTITSYLKRDTLPQIYFGKVIQEKFPELPIFYVLFSEGVQEIVQLAPRPGIYHTGEITRRLAESKKTPVIHGEIPQGIERTLRNIGVIPTPASYHEILDFKGALKRGIEGDERILQGLGKARPNHN